MREQNGRSAPVGAGRFLFLPPAAGKAVPRLRARGASFSCLRRPHFFQQPAGGGFALRRDPLFLASGGPISFSSERNGGKNAAKNPWFLDFLPPRDAAFWFVRNVELTYFSERCRFYSEMRRCTVLHFGRSAAAGTEADQFRISGGLHFAAFARDAERQAPCAGRGWIFKPQV